MNLSELGVVHLVFAFASMASGAAVLLLAKGTRWHRTVGHLYLMSMIGLNGTALGIYRLTGSVTPFHLFALVGLLTLLVGMASVLVRWPRGRWLETHGRWMAGSYNGLMAAFVAETSTRWLMPLVAPHVTTRGAWIVFWVAVALASAATIATGVWLTHRFMPGAVASTPAAMRRERERLRALEGAGPTPSAGD